MRRVIERRCALAFTIVAAVWACPAASWAQTFPSKPVRYVVPFGAGGSPDIVGRLLAERLSRLWGQQVVVENRVGVAGVMGTAYVAKSPPDGYTLTQCNIASSGIAVSLYAKMPYDQLRDIAPVTRIGMTPNILTVHPSVPIRSIKEFIAYARAHPGKLSYASGLVGTSPQLSMELFKFMAKIDVVNIPYKIGAQCDAEAGKRLFVIFGAGRRVARASKPIYESDEAAMRQAMRRIARSSAMIVRSSRSSACSARRRRASISYWRSCSCM